MPEVALHVAAGGHRRDGQIVCGVDRYHPGHRPRGFDVHTQITRACGIMERTNTARSTPSIGRFSRYRPRPVRNRGSSERRAGWPNIEGGSVGTSPCSHRAWGRRAVIERGRRTSEPSEPARSWSGGAHERDRRVAGSPASAAPPKVRVVPVATLANPVGFTFTPDGRIVYAERDTGEVRFLNPRTGSNRLFFRIGGVNSDGERGALGVACTPTGRAPRSSTSTSHAGPGSEPIRNQLIRLRSRARPRAQTSRCCCSHRSASRANHNGGQDRVRPRRQALRRDR